MRSANRMLVALLIVVSLLAAGVVSLVFDVAVSRTAGLIGLGIALAVLLVFWTIVPRLGRTRERTTNLRRHATVVARKTEGT